MVVLKYLRKNVSNACNDLAASGGHLAFKDTFDTIQDSFRWPTMPTDVRTHIEACVSCQHSKSSHRPPELPVGHRPVTRAFQCIVLNLVNYKRLPQGNRLILSVIDRSTRFVILITVKDATTRTIVRHLIERVFSASGPSATLHSDQGKEYDYQLVKELRSVFGYRKRVQPPSAQGNSGLHV